MKIIAFLFVFLPLLLQSPAGATPISYIDDEFDGIRNSYTINVRGSESFSAYFSKYEAPYGPADTLFFLFDSNMRLVIWDDDSGGNFTSKLSEDSLPGGNYHLVVSHYNFWPLDEQGVMFELPNYVASPSELEDFYDQHPVSSLGGPLIGWAFLGNGICGITSYTLALEGVTHLPEPSAILLFGIGLALVGTRRGKLR